MRLDGIEASLIYKFEHHDEEEEEEDEDGDEESEAEEDEVKPVDLNTPELKKYGRMKKMGFPTSAIVNKYVFCL